MTILKFSARVIKIFASGRDSALENLHSIVVDSVPGNEFHDIDGDV